MIIDRSDEIIDSSPNSVWNTRKINKVFDSLDTAIGTTIDTQLLRVSGTQTVQGQKTFTNLYVSDTSGISYESIMSFLQNDISPVINTGAKGISTDVVKELAFTKPNTSGILSPLAQNHPAYRKPYIEVRWGVAGTSTVEYDIKNCPVYTTSSDVFPASTATSWPISQPICNRLRYVTSLSISGTIIGTAGGFPNNPVDANAMILYLTDTNNPGVVLVNVNGSAFPSTPVSGNIKALARVGIRLSTGPVINLNNTINFLGNNTTLPSVMYDLNVSQKLLGESVICNTEVRQSLGVNRFTIPSVVSSSTALYDLGRSTTLYYNKDSEFLDVPLIYNPVSGGYYINSFQRIQIGTIRRIIY